MYILPTFWHFILILIPTKFYVVTYLLILDIHDQINHYPIYIYIYISTFCTISETSDRNHDFAFYLNDSMSTKGFCQQFELHLCLLNMKAITLIMGFSHGIFLILIHSYLKPDNRWLELGWAKYSKVSSTMASSKPIQQRQSTQAGGTSPLDCLYSC